MNAVFSFWLYTMLVLITILNDRLALYNLFFSPIYVAFCVFYAFKVVSKYKFIRYFLFFSIFYAVITLISPEIRGGLNSKWGMLNWEMKVMLTFPPAFYFAHKIIISYKKVRLICGLFLLIAIFSYYLNINLVILNREYDEEGLTNNVGYLFIAIIPLLLTNLKKNFLFLLLSFIFILISLKRGAILCGIFTIPFIMYFAKRQLKLTRKKILFFLILILLPILFFTKGAIRSNDYVAMRVEHTLEGNSSGRDEHYKDMLNKLEYFSIEELIFGKGINHSMKMIGGYAHNDWLELLSSTGIIGCLLYLLNFLVLLYCNKRYCYGNYKIIGYLIILLLFVRTIISMNYFSLDSIPLYYTFGLICFRKELNENSRLYSNLQQL